MEPVTVAADICKPLSLPRRYDSTAVNYVFHCLLTEQKADAMRHLASALAPDGTLFGATVLGELELHNWFSGRALRTNNQRGIFNNLTDTRESLQAALDGAFGSVRIELVGSVAIFSAREPR